MQFPYWKVEVIGKDGKSILTFVSFDAKGTADAVERLVTRKTGPEPVQWENFRFVVSRVEVAA